jgi:multidrug transporter EmrE-like cation transporter
MSLAEFSQWVAGLNLFTSLRESALAYPIIMSLHLSSIAVFGGLILLTDLRLLGLAMPSIPVSNMIEQTRVWKRIGFVVMVTCGVLLGGAKLDKYYDNPYFQFKLLCLLLVGVHALVFHRSVYGNAQALDRSPVIPPVAKAAACVSLALWIGILSLGRWIAYYERPEDRGAPVRASQPMNRVPAAQ